MTALEHVDSSHFGCVERCVGYLSGAPLVSTRPEAGRSGARAHVLGVIRAFEGLGWKTKPFIVGDRLPRRWTSGQAGQRALRSGTAVRLAADIARLAMGIVNGFRASRELGDVDWVYERFGAYQGLGWWFQRRGVPWILETNGLLFIEATRDRASIALPVLAKAVEGWVYRRCTVLICSSKALAELVIARTGALPEKVIVIPSGVDPEVFNPSSHVPRRVFPSRTIGYVGSLQPWQWLDAMIEGLAQVRTEGLDLSLVVVGDGPMRLAWEALAKRLGLDEHVRFLGEVPWADVPSYIAGFDLSFSGQVNLAAGEMYLSPLKLYEYAAMGKPLLASDFDDARKLVDGAACGYLFSPGDREDLMRVVRQAFAERARWPEMGARARQLVLDRHSWTARVRQMIAEASSVIEANNGSV